MKENGKKIIICLLVIAAVMPVGFSVIFLVKQQVIRHEMLEKLEASSLQIIRVSAGEFHWIKKDKEILFNGRMFDIKSFRLENGLYIIHGLYDEDETLLNRLLDNELSNRNNKGNKLLAHFFHWLQTSMPENDIQNLKIPGYNIHQDSNLNLPLSCGFITFPLPPPKC